jgi:hypothetical protein
MCDAGVPVFTLPLFAHPGRSLPLGWSLTAELLADMGDVFALGPNLDRARAFSCLFEGCPR